MIAQTVYIITERGVQPPLPDYSWISFVLVCCFVLSVLALVIFRKD